MKWIRIPTPIVSVLMMGFMACGNNTMGSEEDLVGSWVFVDVVFADDLLDALFTEYDFININRGGTLNFHADGTFNSEDAWGIWSIQGDKLTVTVNGEVLTYKYNIDGDKLSLSVDRTDFMNMLTDLGASSSEIDFFRQNVRSDLILQLVLRRA